MTSAELRKFVKAKERDEQAAKLSQQRDDATLLLKVSKRKQSELAAAKVLAMTAKGKRHRDHIFYLLFVLVSLSKKLKPFFIFHVYNFEVSNCVVVHFHLLFFSVQTCEIKMS